MFSTVDFKLHCTISIVLFLLFFVISFIFGEKKFLTNLVYAFFITMAVGFFWEILQGFFKEGSDFSFKDLLSDFIGCSISFLLIFLIWK